MNTHRNHFQARCLSLLLCLALLAGLAPAALAIPYQTGLEQSGYTQGDLICDKKYDCNMEEGDGRKT